MKIFKAFDENKIKNSINIKFWSDDVIYVDDIVSIIYDEKVRYFKINSVETDDYGRLIAYASNYGYYNLLKKIDLRNLLELPVTLVNDEEIIKKLLKESHFM